MTGPDPAERIRRLISAPTGAGSPLVGALAWAATAAALALPMVLALGPALLLANTAHLGG